MTIMPAFMEMSTHPFAALFLWHGKCWPLSLTHKSLRFPSTIDHPDHHLTTTHANARGASPEKALRAFYMVFNFVHNQREMASQSHFYLTVRELRPGRPLVRIQSGAPSRKLHPSLGNEAGMQLFSPFSGRKRGGRAGGRYSACERRPPGAGRRLLFENALKNSRFSDIIHMV